MRSHHATTQQARKLAQTTFVVKSRATGKWSYGPVTMLRLLEFSEDSEFETPAEAIAEATRLWGKSRFEVVTDEN